MSAPAWKDRPDQVGFWFLRARTLHQIETGGKGILSAMYIDELLLEAYKTHSPHGIHSRFYGPIPQDQEPEVQG